MERFLLLVLQGLGLLLLLLDIVGTLIYDIGVDLDMASTWAIIAAVFAIEATLRSSSGR